MTADAALRAPRIVGFLALGAGVVAILVPAVASVATAIFIGWILMFTGLITIASAVSHEGMHRLLRGVWGVVALIAGLYLVLAPLHGTVTLTFVLVVNFLLIGSMRIAAWWSARGRPGAGAVGINGVFSILIALLILASFPSSADWAIGLLVGIDLMFFGFAVLGATSALKAASGPSSAPPASA